ncbi:tetratricopeptide repeat protein [Nisaea sediminum]|uniref:tetratricopeptide repeat-containing glycosyltransferase family protein n=1 Tax=Nisaea sediminum TaxID=2775867 RepID=UPI0018663F72|nr:tetratricopeptide repeat-containing glycosyltransferase family protein [Nisaea sediminum]
MVRQSATQGQSDNGVNPKSGERAEAGSFQGMLDVSRTRHRKLNSQAVEMLNASEWEKARKIFMQVLDENEEDATALHGVGIVARKMGRLEVARELMQRALKFEPRNHMIMSNLGVVQEDLKDYEGALKSFRAAARAAPKVPEYHVNQASVLSKMNRRSEALIANRKAFELGIRKAEPLTNLGVMLADIGDFAQAEKYFRKALEIDPENAHAHHNFGTVLLRQGRWDEAWFHSEWRMAGSTFLPESKAKRAFAQPLWNGNPFHGARLFLYAEQGIGDEIRFASMIPEAIARGGEVVVECERRLVTLFQRSFPETRVVPANYWPAERGVEPFDIVLPFGSLGRLFRTSQDAFPEHSGYIKPDLALVAEFRDRLKAAGPGPYVGLCWRSGLSGAYRNEYYAAIEDMAPILKVKGVTFVNLQYDATADELEAAHNISGVDLVRWDDVDLKMDLEKAAALTSCMDLVVSPATSVSVMAGAIGIETLEFRPFPVADTYFRKGRCTWFPSVRYVAKRQSEKWNKVLRKIAGEVAALPD